jgi:hypothetical protein
MQTLQQRVDYGQRCVQTNRSGSRVNKTFDSMTSVIQLSPKKISENVSMDGVARYYL